MNKLTSDGRCYLIAEAGSNHDGKLDQAFALINAAAEAGVDAVKFQMFKAARLYTQNAGPSAYLGRGESIVDIIKAMEMPESWLPKLGAACRDLGLDLLISAFDEQSLAAVDPFVAAHKCASYEMTHLPLVRAMAKTGKPLIMSTGTANIDEVATSLAAAREANAKDVVLLQCTAAYPTPLADVNVRAMLTLAELGAAVGLSDHSRDPVIAPCAAVSLGAVVIEKHFTLSNRLAGPDHEFAIEPDELIQLVRAVRMTESALGNAEKISRPIEAELRRFARRSIFTIQPIGAGDVLTPQNIAVLRAGQEQHGLPPAEWDAVLGKPTCRALPAGLGLQRDDLAR